MPHSNTWDKFFSPLYLSSIFRFVLFITSLLDIIIYVILLSKIKAITRDKLHLWFYELSLVLETFLVLLLFLTTLNGIFDWVWAEASCSFIDSLSNSLQPILWDMLGIMKYINFARSPTIVFKKVEPKICFLTKSVLNYFEEAQKVDYSCKVNTNTFQFKCSGWRVSNY